MSDQSDARPHDAEARDARATEAVATEVVTTKVLTVRSPLDVVDLWPVLFFVGLITLAAGIVVLAWPSETLTVVSIVVGAQILVYSVFRLVQAFRSATIAPPLLVGISGVMGMVMAIAVLRRPFQAAAVLAALLGIVWLVGGVIELLAAASDATQANRGLSALSAGVSIIAGVVVVSWPAPTITVLAWIAGFYLVVFGMMICLMAWKLRTMR